MDVSRKQAFTRNETASNKTGKGIFARLFSYFKKEPKVGQKDADIGKNSVSNVGSSSLSGRGSRVVIGNPELMRVDSHSLTPANGDGRAAVSVKRHTYSGESTTSQNVGSASLTKKDGKYVDEKGGAYKNLLSVTTANCCGGSNSIALPVSPLLLEEGPQTEQTSKLSSTNNVLASGSVKNAADPGLKPPAPITVRGNSGLNGKVSMSRNDYAAVCKFAVECLEYIRPNIPTSADSKKIKDFTSCLKYYESEANDLDDLEIQSDVCKANLFEIREKIKSFAKIAFGRGSSEYENMPQISVDEVSKEQLLGRN
jgi:hypothetical protein